MSESTRASTENTLQHIETNNTWSLARLVKMTKMLCQKITQEVDRNSQCDTALLPKAPLEMESQIPYQNLSDPIPHSRDICVNYRIVTHKALKQEKN